MNIKKFLQRIFARRYIDIGRCYELKRRGITPLFFFSTTIQGRQQYERKMQKVQTIQTSDKTFESRTSHAPYEFICRECHDEIHGIKRHPKSNKKYQPGTVRWKKKI
jgi:hypothetical protein